MKADSAPRALIRVVAALIVDPRDASRFLVQQRLPNKSRANLWEFPGGKVEPGETFEIALVRELREELGIEVVVGELLETIEHEYPEKRVRLKFFRCKWEAHEPQPLGCPAFAWITREELSRYEFPAADARLLDLLRTRPELWR